MGVSPYVDQLMGYLKETYQCVQRHQQTIRDKRDVAAQDDGTLGMELQIRDVVMLRLDPNKSGGPTRFRPRVRDQLWRIKAKISPDISVSVSRRSECGV